MKKRSLKDVIFVIGLIVVIWLALKILFWTLAHVFLLAVLALIIYVLYRFGVFSALFRK